MYIYTPLHSIYISACTSIIPALHVFYKCLGYHIYIHAPAPPQIILCNYPPPPPSPCYIHTIHASNLCVYFAQQSFTVILKLPSPPKILILYRTLITVYLCNNGIRFTKKFILQFCIFRLRCNYEENSLYFGSFSHGQPLKSGGGGSVVWEQDTGSRDTNSH